MSREGRVCPAGYAGFLGGAYRKLFHDPDRILAGLVHPGETAADLGCGPAFFGPALARLVSSSGKVILADLQQSMLDNAQRRMTSSGFADRVQYHRCEADRIGLDEPLDFALAFYMVHEVPDARAFLAEMFASLKPGGRFLIVEPKFHVTASAFRSTLATATGLGFTQTSEPRVFFSRSVLLAKPG